MGRKQKSITINNCELPEAGWVMWRGEATAIELLFRQALQLEPCDNLKTLNIDGEKKTLKLAAIFEWGGLLSNKTLLENILLPQEYVGKCTTECKEKVYKLFSDFKYEDFLDKRPFYVPRNVQKLSGIVRAFFQEPDVIFAQNLVFGLNQRDIGLLRLFMKEYRNMNIHFSDTAMYPENEFDVIIDYKKWEKAG